ncbi:SdiA-regulated domain-containing protein [Lewinella sp. LCG006]|uniref:SdiA-regulated domain-containing protein n=1 Tax=Lewinella sp. LCG006 TaxID=3231911 RepID=UPI00345F2D05
MKMDLQNSTTVTWLIVVAILVIAIGYSVFAINNKPPQMAFTVATDYTFPYKIDTKGFRTELNSTLKEISGITSINLDQVMAIQDEKGILFTVDLNSGNIVSQTPFDKDRDYEDLCLVGDHVFILERDGDLYQFHLAVPDTVQKFETSFSYRNDTEGLCFDASRNRLLIAPKEGAPDDVAELPKNIKGVYAFDLITKRVKPEPIITIAEKEIGRIIGNGGKPYNFKPSAVAVHPKTGHIYVLASVGKILIIVDPVTNQVMHVQLLDEEAFPQPEGMTFDASDNLLISSEGLLGKAASITRFTPKTIK